MYKDIIPPQQMRVDELKGLLEVTIDLGLWTVLNIDPKVVNSFLFHFLLMAFFST